MKAIVSDDIHFYEPAAKDWSPARKAATKRSGSGKVSKFLSKQHHIQVKMIEPATVFFKANRRKA